MLFLGLLCPPVHWEMQLVSLQVSLGNCLQGDTLLSINSGKGLAVMVVTQNIEGNGRMMEREVLHKPVITDYTCLWGRRKGRCLQKAN